MENHENNYVNLVLHLPFYKQRVCCALQFYGRSLLSIDISFLALQIISAISGGITDLSFDAVGYTWQIVNCVLTASYSVCITLNTLFDSYTFALILVCDTTNLCSRSVNKNLDCESDSSWCRSLYTFANANQYATFALCNS